MIQVLLASKRPLVRAGIRNTLIAQHDLTLVDEVHEVHLMKQVVRGLNLDVIILDLCVDIHLVIEAVSYLNLYFPNVKLLVLAADGKFVHDLIRAGITGYVLENEEVHVLPCAIRSMTQGSMWLSQSTLSEVTQCTQTKLENSVQPETLLTRRELQVLSMVALGWNNARIASKLFLAEQTIRNYLSRVYAKISVTSRTEAMLWATKNGVVLYDANCIK